MESLAEAAAAVRAARRRLFVISAADGAARGALVGALLGGASWLVARWTHVDAATWPLVAPVVGAVVGTLAASRRGVDVGSAALALDAAARTNEAFVSSVSATDAVDEMRVLAADYAVTRCPRAAVGRFLPIRAPSAASAAAVATALVAALVLVPRAAATEDARPSTARTDESVAGATASPSAETSPRERVERLRSAVEKNGAREATSLAPAVRRDLGAVTDAELRKLAAALAAKPTSADAAKRALAALDRGDRAAATAALRDALGGTPSVASPNGTGTATAAATSVTSPAAWSGATWPLRYDGVVRRWFEQSAAAESEKK
jgi:hypothetical protein